MSTTTVPPVPALVVGTVRHARRIPLHNVFTHRHVQWLVDVDDLPRFRWPLGMLARFEARDHLDGGRLGGRIRGDVERFLTRRGISLAPTDRVLMLAGARFLGYAFDPLTVFWCLSRDGHLDAVVLEVHNTYGERHAYLLDVDERGAAQVGKAFYVSPFNDVSGSYSVRLRLERDVVGVSIGLDRHDGRVMTATSTGTPVAATPRALLRATARQLLTPQRVITLIRLHGVALWLRRLPVLPRPRHGSAGVR